jgi:hypothetical protein
MTPPQTILHAQEGIQNTDETLACASRRAHQLDITQIVVATTTGQTALACARAMPHGCSIIAVTMHATDAPVHVSRHGSKVLAKDPAIMDAARQAGVRFYTGVHPFRGSVSSALNDRFGGSGAQDVLAEALMRFFSTGVKVAIECSLMAADAGLIDASREVIALGGYRGGADTALVLKPAFSYRLFELNIREILAFPRTPA